MTGEGGKPDGHIVAADALAIINYINAFGPGAIPAGAQIGRPHGYLDTSGGMNDVGDDLIAPADALAVINAINAGQGGEGEGGATGVRDVAASTASPQFHAVQHDDWADLLALLALDTAQQSLTRRSLRR